MKENNKLNSESKSWQKQFARRSRKREIGGKVKKVARTVILAPWTEKRVDYLKIKIKEELGRKEVDDSLNDPKILDMWGLDSQ